MTGSEFAERRATLIQYLNLKVAMCDWHGVADAACDLRDMEAEERGRSQCASGKITISCVGGDQ